MIYSFWDVKTCHCRCSSVVINYELACWMLAKMMVLLISPGGAVAPRVEAKSWMCSKWFSGSFSWTASFSVKEIYSVRVRVVLADSECNIHLLEPSRFVQFFSRNSTGNRFGFDWAFCLLGGQILSSGTALGEGLAVLLLPLKVKTFKGNLLQVLICFFLPTFHLRMQWKTILL